MFAPLHSLGKTLWWVTSRVFAPFIAIGLLVMILYGWLVANPADLAALSLQKHEIAMLLGAAPSERSYIVIPRVFEDAGVVSVLRTAPVFTSQSNSGAALILLLMWGACAFLTYRYYWRPRARHLTIGSSDRGG
jgi:hypothetical protein